MMGRRHKFTLWDIYEELLQAGHTQIWLREVNRPNPCKRILITWDNYVLGCYKPVLDGWFLCKNSQLVNANTRGLHPPGPGLSELDEGEIFNLTLQLY
ncbi:hypothetical protein [Leclercia adecarboxylata]|uniref:hypothetical protein n=1 Tax=Leclercia adecarboxylata TaxID=83655 RepID=UPI00301B565D